MSVQDLPPDPSSAQRDLWWGYVIEADGADPDGWWLGHCPLHDKEAASVDPTAQFNFRHGALRCMGSPPCHDRRSMSLNRVLIEMVRATA